ncbi:MAG: dihydropteroate synthase [Bacteroidales bacterium]|nr:dihydropteroate synthase [Bacteroidales bacterium]
MTITCKGKLLDLNYPVVMGILNITPDSFYDGGLYLTKEQILLRAKQIVNEGAEIIDVGAYSSRPGAANISVNEELNRLDNALTVIKKEMPDACISVDTFRPEVVQKVVQNFNVDIINDIYAGTASKNMLETIANNNVAYIMMHMQGTPQNMQTNPQYDDVVLDIIKFFSERINKAVNFGINDIIIDPGLGFGKLLDHNFQIISRLDEFKIIDYPILVGVSRKSMIYKYLNISPQESLTGTISLNTIALNKGANILRVHDVKEAVETIKIVNKINNFAN